MEALTHPVAVEVPADWLADLSDADVRVLVTLAHGGRLKPRLGVLLGPELLRLVEQRAKQEPDAAVLIEAQLAELPLLVVEASATCTALDYNGRHPAALAFMRRLAGLLREHRAVADALVEPLASA